MTHFWWVRHGPTHEKNFVGWRDVPADLSDTALIQRVAAYLPTDAVVISSDLIRSIDTATAIQGNRTRLPHDHRLKEFNFGAWDGLNFGEVSARDPKLSRDYWEKPGDLEAPGGESWNQVAARVNTAVDDLQERFGGRNIIVVAHFGVIMTQIQHLYDGDAYKAMGHQIDNFSVTDLQFDGVTWRPGHINHLPE